MEASWQAATDPIAKAGEWFLRSGIQEPDGGVSRYYLSEQAQNAPVSTEITGYAASALISQFRACGDARFLAAAKAAAAYLVSAWDEESKAMPFECRSSPQKRSCFFDMGIIVRGLLTVWRETGDPALLVTADRCAECMAADFFDGRQFGAVLSLPEKVLLPSVPAQWSMSPGCYQLKAALAWYELSEIRHEERYLALYRRMLHMALQSHSTFLPGAEDASRVMDRLHAYLYFLEGLLPAAAEGSCAEALRFGIAEVSRFIELSSAALLRADVLAQLLRVRLFADQCGAAPLDTREARENGLALSKFQSLDGDPRLHGGFWFGRRAGTIAPFMNPWATAFAAQALSMWNAHGGNAVDWRTLI